MVGTQTEKELSTQFFQQFLAQAISLKGGPDPEITLEALLDAAEQLRAHLEQELAEWRAEQAE